MIQANILRVGAAFFGCRRSADARLLSCNQFFQFLYALNSATSGTTRSARMPVMHFSS